MWVAMLFNLAAAIFLLSYKGDAPIAFALCGRDVEFGFLVVDHGSGQPIPNAEVRIDIEESSVRLEKAQSVSLTADQKGEARLVKKDTLCEDIIRPSGTVTHMDTLWGTFHVHARNYMSIEWAQVGDFDCKHNVYDRAARTQKLTYIIRMKPI
jgi:hypothetical protein